jgi:hypothetical protein
VATTSGYRAPTASLAADPRGCPPKSGASAWAQNGDSENGGTRAVAEAAAEVLAPCGRSQRNSEGHVRRSRVMDRANAHRATASAMAVRETLATERLRTIAFFQALHYDFDSIVEARRRPTPMTGDTEDRYDVGNVPAAAH